jgi:cytosine/adenosine deaminase-related metal-dependent hydrolase
LTLVDRRKGALPRGLQQSWRWTGALAPGFPADFVVIDLDRLDRDRIMPVDPRELLFSIGRGWQRISEKWRGAAN